MDERGVRAVRDRVQRAAHCGDRMTTTVTITCEHRWSSARCEPELQREIRHCMLCNREQVRLAFERKYTGWWRNQPSAGKTELRAGRTVRVRELRELTADEVVQAHLGAVNLSWNAPIIEQPKEPSHD